MKSNSLCCLRINECQRTASANQLKLTVFVQGALLIWVIAGRVHVTICSSQVVKGDDVSHRSGLIM